MKTCQTCGYWKTMMGYWKGEAITLGTDRFRPCHQPHLHTAYGVFEHAEEDAVICVNGEADGLMYTGAQYGCVHWMPKEE